MARPTMQKQSVCFAELLEWSQTNPNKSKTLAPIEIFSEDQVLRRRDADAKIDRSLETIQLPAFESITLSPSGILSAIAFMTDETYAYSPVRIRNTMLRELATTLQQNTDNLSGTSLARKRKRIHDGVAALANASAVKPEEWIDLFSSLAIMNKLQIIFIQMSKVEVTATHSEEEEGDNTNEKAIYFSSDPDTWTNVNKTWIVDYYGRWIATPKNEQSFETLRDWIEDIEIHGWNVHWHYDASVTKDILIEQLSSLPGWQKDHAKLKKDILLARLAKYKAQNAIYRLTSSDE